MFYHNCYVYTYVILCILDVNNKRDIGQGKLCYHSLTKALATRTWRATTVPWVNGHLLWPVTCVISQLLCRVNVPVSDRHLPDAASGQSNVKFCPC